MESHKSRPNTKELFKPKQIRVQFEVNKPFGNLFRTQHVLIACQRADGSFVFGCKKGFYPDGICRLVGGGVEESDGEANSEASFLKAAKEEVEEELLYKPDSSELIHLGDIRANATDSQGIKYNLATHIYYIKLPKGQEVTASDDITDIVDLSLEDIHELAEHYFAIPEELHGSEGGLEYSWQDYGKLYGPIHQFTYEALVRLLS